ncbi:GNAT family N-acetyltransferase [Aureimonas sp. SK2]|uniref:GNAT family N-acetyltransferase n=1 Tax=Aureimonas sp. SK2 TaxID=3015992 RepID=UPI002443C345|nr:GNAT family N-acetyltransferase [Aureimonas sp. SK2]
MNGRKAFKGMAPEGYRIRMMEPGEAEALRDIDAAADRLLVEAGHFPDPGLPDLGRFVAFLLAREVFVAEEKGGAAVGFAAAADLAALTGDPAGGGCYWLSALCVDPAHGRRGLGSALLAAVVKRAEWFFHRAVGLSTARDLPFGESFYAGHRFLRVADDDLTPALLKRYEMEWPTGASPGTRTVMVRWL